jgi:hypothetical protein
VCLSWAHLFSWHKTDRTRNSAENTHRYKIHFQHSVFIWKSLGNFFYHLTTLSRNEESKWKRTVRLNTLIYLYYFSLFPALLIYQFGIYKPRLCTFMEPKCSILCWKQLVNSRFPGPNDPIHIASKFLLYSFLILHSHSILRYYLKIYRSTSFSPTNFSFLPFVLQVPFIRLYSILSSKYYLIESTYFKIPNYVTFLQPSVTSSLLCPKSTITRLPVF